MATVAPEEKQADPDEEARLERIKNMPPLEDCYNLSDFEFVARQVMKRTAWAYYSSGADDEITLRENRTAFHKIWFRPRVLVDVERVDTACTMLGSPSALPFYVTATALGKLGHPDGEVVLTRAAARHGAIQMIPTLASCSFDEIVGAADGKQTQWFQLYVNRDRNITARIVRQAEAGGCKGLFVTVDAPQLGRREKDMRSRYTGGQSHVQQQHRDGRRQDGGENEDEAIDRSQGAARAISSFIDPSLSWKDIPYFQQLTAMPVVLKGVQRVDDVVKAVEHGLHGVVLSNHGGRQLDTAPTAIELLAEVMAELRARNWQDRIEVYVDGGVRRASDVVKAMCLGAKGVGIGRPFLYAMSAYGEPGVVRAMQLLRDELEMNMRLLGATRIADLTPDLVDVRGLSVHTVPGGADVLQSAVYAPLASPAFKAKARL